MPSSPKATENITDLSDANKLLSDLIKEPVITYPIWEWHHTSRGQVKVKKEIHDFDMFLKGLSYLLESNKMELYKIAKDVVLARITGNISQAITRLKNLELILARKNKSLGSLPVSIEKNALIEQIKNMRDSADNAVKTYKERMRANSVLIEQVGNEASKKAAADKAAADKAATDKAAADKAAADKAAADKAAADKAAADKAAADKAAADKAAADKAAAERAAARIIQEIRLAAEREQQRTLEKQRTEKEAQCTVLLDSINGARVDHEDYILKRYVIRQRAKIKNMDPQQLVAFQIELQEIYAAVNSREIQAIKEEITNNLSRKKQSIFCWREEDKSVVEKIERIYKAMRAIPLKDRLHAFSNENHPQCNQVRIELASHRHCFRSSALTNGKVDLKKTVAQSFTNLHNKFKEPIEEENNFNSTPF